MFKFKPSTLCVSVCALAILAANAWPQSKPRKHNHTLVPRAAITSQAKPRLDAQITVPDDLVAQVRELQGYAIAPVKLNLDGRDTQLVGLGSYLVNAVADCAGCHSKSLYTSDGNPFNGQPAKIDPNFYLGGGMAFGPFTSRNLTPEPENGNLPAGLSLDDFMLVMRTGQDLDQQHLQVSPLLQVMPWPRFRSMTDLELRAIYEYLSAIPPVNVTN
jgi:hypothetical protein